MEPLEHAQFEALIEGLMANGFAYLDDFLDAKVVAGLRSRLLSLYSNGEMYVAGLGNKEQFQKNDLIRGDQICWLDDASQDPLDMEFMGKIGRFVQHLNATCYTAITGFEAHYACYQQRSFYKRHLDQFKRDKGRKYSIILYLNEDWKVEDGGLLSLYPEGAEQVDVSPFGGRLVFFESAVLEHEVHPSFTRDRLSIAGWLKG